jgi:tRNA A37 threonylcarbamoyltransferase TsaD
MMGKLTGGALVEHLARYGDPTKYEMPIPMSNKAGCNMSYAGLYTQARFSFYEKPPTGETKGLYERNRIKFEFADLLNLANSMQFAAIYQVYK